MTYLIHFMFLAFMSLFSCAALLPAASCIALSASEYGPSYSSCC